MTEVREAKAVAIFEPIAQESVDPDVVHSNQRNRQRNGQVQQQCTESQSRRRNLGVKCIVNARSPARSGEISEHRKIRRQPKRREEPPVGPSAGVEDRRDGGDREPFKAQEEPNRSPAHRCECRLLQSCCHD